MQHQVFLGISTKSTVHMMCAQCVQCVQHCVFPVSFTCCRPDAWAFHLTSSSSCADELAPRRDADQFRLFAPAGCGLVCFWIPTWSTQRQHLGATSLPHDFNRLRIKALFALLCPLERHGHERVDHGALQRDGSLQESRCRVWCPKDRLEHRSGARGETFGLKPGNLGPSSVTA